MQFHADAFFLPFFVGTLLFGFGLFGFGLFGLFAAALVVVFLLPDSFFPNANAQLLAYSFVAPTRLMVTDLLLVNSSTKQRGGNRLWPTRPQITKRGLSCWQRSQTPLASKPSRSISAGQEARGRARRRAISSRNFAASSYCSVSTASCRRSSNVRPIW